MTTELTYRAAVAEGIAREMDRDPSVVLIGEDVGAAGGVFKLTEGLFARFGEQRVRDTPISEQAIVGAAMGAAMTGLRPIAELMFSDFFAVTWDMVINQIAKARYMTDGQVSIPIVLQTANGSGLRFGAQHSQSVENWAMAIPGLKVVAPATPADVRRADGLRGAQRRPGDLLRQQVAVRDARATSPTATTSCPWARPPSCARAATARSSRSPPWSRGPSRRRDGSRPTTGSTPRSSTCAASCRSMSPRSSGRSRRRAGCSRSRRTRGCCGWGAEIVSIVADEGFWSLDAPIGRITTPHIPLPSAASLEDLAVPGVDRIVDTVRRRMEEAK